MKFYKEVSPITFQLAGPLSSIVPKDGIADFPAVDGDFVYRMNPTTEASNLTRSTRVPWSPAPPPIRAGEAFWFKLATARTWVQHLDVGGTLSNYSITNSAYLGGAGPGAP